MLQLALLAGERADMLVDNAGTLELTAFVEENAMLYNVNVELAALWDHLILSNEDWALKKYVVKLEANKEDYLLPKDFYKFRKIFPLDSSGNRGKPMRRFDMERLGKEDIYNIPVVSGTFDRKYRVMGMRIYFDPVPLAAEDAELWYYQDYPHVENDLDLVPVHYPKGWEDYVVEGCAARLMEKIESDSSPMRSRQKEVLARIISVIQDRDLDEPHQMIDMEEEYYW
jgi:hypothetical protein